MPIGRRTKPSPGQHVNVSTGRPTLYCLVSRHYHLAVKARLRKASMAALEPERRATTSSWRATRGRREVWSQRTRKSKRLPMAVSQKEPVRRSYQPTECAKLLCISRSSDLVARREALDSLRVVATPKQAELLKPTSPMKVHREYPGWSGPVELYLPPSSKNNLPLPERTSTMSALPTSSPRM